MRSRKIVRARSVKDFKLKVQIPTERYEQIKLAAWLDKLGVLYTASANGELRDRRTGALLKRMGVKAGHPDIVVYESRSSYHGLLIELKRIEGGVLRPIQKWWADRLSERGFLCLRANGFLEAKKMVLEYLGNLGSLRALEKFKDDNFDDREPLPSFGSLSGLVK